MIIAVNARHLIAGKLEGIGRFANETLKRITQGHPECRFVFIFDRPYAEEFIYSRNIIPVVSFPPARHPLLWYAFFEWGIPPVLRKYKPDLFYSPDGWLSLKTRTKSLPVIHDLNFMHMPELLPPMVRKYYGYYFPRFVKKASRIITVSEYSKNDIVNTFKYDPEFIDVVYNGADESFAPVSLSDQVKIRQKYTSGCAYFLFLGLIHPRKNLTNIMYAFNGFRNTHTDRVKLLVAGERKWWTDEMQQAYDRCNYKEDIVFLGRVNSPSLNEIIGSAAALVYTSFFEGFGLPVLEAMYSNVPVICSPVTSMPEVGGNAVMYADPFNPESIKDAMLKIYNDREFRNKLLKNAILQRGKFTWDKTSWLVWNAIEKSLT